MWEFFYTSYEPVKLSIKLSVKHEAMLHLVKEEVESYSPSFKMFCPIKWTVRADASTCTLANYEEIQGCGRDALESNI